MSQFTDFTDFPQTSHDTTIYDYFEVAQLNSHSYKYRIAVN